MKTLTVGIPAYNEEANIHFLIKDLLSQNQTGFKLKNIIVNSDGSSDNTTKEVKRIKNKKIILLHNKKRAGRILRQNQIMKLSNADVLVLLDADTQVKDKDFLRKIVAPIIKGKADLTSARVEELEPENFMEKILETSMKLKKYIFENINKGDNLYTCHGRSRAFSKKLYKTIKFNDSVAEDAYSYLFCISRGMVYKFVGNTEIYYKLPSDFSDHKKQSIRFIKSQKSLINEFGEKLVEDSYMLPPLQTLTSLIKFAIKKPIPVSLYILIFGYIKVMSLFKNVNIIWEISTSSKTLRKEIV